ncbi:hypothetical protein JTE90_012241 [Oedothorax gibbosus]|uniref:Uncharacterized protein n=1 Tax=Oedothorax gibbosus TaxID=931172 RepID=A0AAV6UWR1_9ARAC|nr:hypothetical protein JTE90_012241 [Oedothorax gibbosus]
MSSKLYQIHSLSFLIITHKTPYRKLTHPQRHHARRGQRTSPSEPPSIMSARVFHTHLKINVVFDTPLAAPFEVGHKRTDCVILREDCVILREGG